MRITKLFGALALGGILAAGVAYAAATSSTPALPAPQAEGDTAATPVTATWAMGVAPDQITGVSTNENLSLSFAMGEFLSGAGTKDFDGVTMTKFCHTNIVAFQKTTNYLEFTITPNSSEKFVPSSLSFEYMNSGWGDGRYTVDAVCGSVTKNLHTATVGEKPVRDNEADISQATRTVTLGMSGLTATMETPLVVRVYLTSKSNQGDETKSVTRNAFVANVKIVGEMVNPDTETAPAGWAVIPGTLNKIEESTNNTEAGWTIGGAIKYDSQDGQFGSIKNGGWCSTNFFCDKAGAYNLVVPFKWDQSSGQNDDIRIEITDQTTGKKEIDQHYAFTGGRTEQTIPLEGVMTRGRKTIKFTFTSPGTGYITNIMAPTFNWVSESYDSNKTPAGYLEMPGTLTISKTYWSENGLIIEKAETDTPNFGYASNGNSATAKVFCKEAGVYSANIDFYAFYSVGDVTLEVTDEATGNVEAKTIHHLTAAGKTDIVLGGKITTGKKDLKISFTNVGGSFCANFYAPVVTKIADEFAQVAGVTVEGIENSAAEGYDWNFLLPEAYAGENVVLNVAAENGAVTADGEPVVDGKVAVATPAAGQETIVNLALTANDGAYAAQTEYAVRIFHIGDVQVASLTVDGKDVTTDELLAALNSEAAAATIAGNCYTAVPAVSATMLDGTTAAAEVTLEGTTATATFTGKAGDNAKTFTLAIEGVHTYTAAENDKIVEIKYDAALKGETSWSNGLYTILNCNDGYGSWFKLNRSNVTWEVPANVVVKQMVFKSLKENYDHVSSISSIAAGDAVVYLPTNNEFVIGDATAYDLVVNFENHVAGTPVEISFNSQGQPMAWFEFIVEEQKLQGEPTVQNGSNTQVDTKNHCVVTLDFGRKMQECVAEYNGKAVKADGGTTALKFSLWELAWGEETVLTIPAGAAKDVDGNANSEAITYTVAVAQQPTTVDPVEAVTYVSDVEGLRAAVASVMESNNTADAPRHIIYLKNGDYDLGSSTEAAPILHMNKAYNVSIIGESRDGVVVRGTIPGISYPVFSVRNSTNTYLENFTIKNELGVDGGVGVALNGGNRDVLVNMTLLGYQDTYVTGEQGYHFNCEIHGSVDYICGGGNHYFDSCTFVNDREGAVICAPSTSASAKWGYVFQNCAVKGSSYALGRPWQNEPRAYFLNTTMETLANAGGWLGMGDRLLTTHFYEYNSMDAAGNAVDLSGRVNPSTSANTYDPVLTAEEAAEFTVENVLGGDDSWLATEELALGLEAPEGVEYVKSDKGDHAEYIHWLPVSGAAGYLLFNNGEFVGYAPGNHDSFDLLTNSSYIQPETQSRAGETFSYTIRAISPNGTMSAHSMAMTPQNPTGIEAVGADAVVKVEYYNLQGQPVSEGYRGAAIKVETSADGTRVASKVLAD